MPVIAIIVLVLGILLILAGLYLIKSNKDKAEKIGNAEEKARNIIDEALKAAETKKREGLLELMSSILCIKPLELSKFCDYLSLVKTLTQHLINHDHHRHCNDTAQS